MRAAVSLLVIALSGCLLFDEPDLGEDEDDPSERVDCFADLPDEAFHRHEVTRATTASSPPPNK